MWDMRRILKDITDEPKRRRIMASFWRNGEPSSRALVLAQLGKALHFREETLRKLPMEKKADMLASRAGTHEFDQYLEMALMTYHTHEMAEMLGAFLDLWSIPHKSGAIETDDYKVPTEGQVRDAVHQLEQRYDRRDIALYLASAGLLMGDEWREVTWPVVDELMAVA